MERDAVRAPQEDGDAHILLLLGAVGAAVAAVVGGDDQMVRSLRCLRYPADALPRAPEGVQIVRAHPAPVVAGAVGEAQIQEEEVRRRLRHPGQGGVGQAAVGVRIVPVVHEAAEAEAAGDGDVPQLLPVAEHGGGPSGVMEDLQ